VEATRLGSSALSTLLGGKVMEEERTRRICLVQKRLSKKQQQPPYGLKGKEGERYRRPAAKESHTTHRRRGMNDPFDLRQPMSWVSSFLSKGVVLPNQPGGLERVEYISTDRRTFLKATGITIIFRKWQMNAVGRITGQKPGVPAKCRTGQVFG